MLNITETKPNTHKNYSLYARVMDINPKISLNEEEFLQIKQAKSCLNSALSLEENFDLLLGNYRELELEAISAAVSDMTESKYEYEDFFHTRSSINRRVVNLLSAARMYLDHYPQHLNKIGESFETAKSVASESYDRFFEYRFMEALRNYTQHSGLAVHELKLGGQWLSTTEPRQQQFAITAYSSRSILENSSFKKSVLRETPIKVEVLPAIRIYLSCISSIHNKVREIIDSKTKQSRDLFADLIARHEKEANHKHLGLAAVAKVNERVVEEIPILLDWDDVRIKLLKRNKSLEHIDKCFVTSQSIWSKQ